MDTSILTQDREFFFFLVAQCQANYRQGHDLANYRKIVKLHRETCSLDSILENNGFCDLIWDTLEAWNMNQQGARLASRTALRDSILKHRNALNQLYRYKLHRLSKLEIIRNVRSSLYAVFTGLKVMDSKRRIVGVSKALHFLLPDLVIPIDGKYTMQFLYGYNRYSSDPNVEFETFMRILFEAHTITKKLGLSESDISGQGWNTSIPKLIDNAIIGFFKYIEGNDLQQAKAEQLLQSVQCEAALQV